MNPIEVFNTMDWYNYARFMCVIAFIGYASFFRESKVFGFLGMIACSFLFFRWETMVVFAFDSLQWIAAYMVLCVGFVSALTIVGAFWMLMLLVFLALVALIIVAAAALLIM